MITLLLAGRALAADPVIPYETFTLPNGLQVLLAEDHHLPLVTVNTWYHVGAGNEVPGRSGFAHLFEHIMFQGSRDVAEDTYFRYLEGVGASDINGTTDFDRTNYYETVPANQLDLALWLESDRMGYLTDTLTQERLDNQRGVVRKERQQTTENVPYGVASETVFHLLYPQPHPYYGAVIGSHADLEAATLDDVKSFFTTYYAPNNATLVVLGDFQPAEAKAKIEKYYGAIPSQPAPPKITTAIPVFGDAIDGMHGKPAPGVGSAEPRAHAELTDEVELPAVMQAWVGPAILGPGDAELALGAAILGQGRSSRMYETLVYDQQVAQDVNVTWYPLDQGGVFEVDVYGKPGSDPTALAAAANAVIDGMRTDGPTAEEVARVRRSLESGVLQGLQSQVERADTLNYYNQHAHDPAFLAKDLARYRAVTPEGIRDAMAAVLKPDTRIVVTVTPATQASTK
jgi:zinc protease